MTTRLIGVAATAMLAAGLASPAFAQDAKLSATLGAATDYVWRGVSQTDEKPFVFGTVDLTAGDFYAGVGAENVDFGNSINVEYDLYAGWRPKLGAATLDLGVVRYGYANQPSGVDIDTLEGKAGASLPVGGGSVSGFVAYTSDYFGSGASGTYGELDGSAAPFHGWTLSGAIGRQEIDAGTGYSTWNLGLSHPIGKATFDVRYHDTDVHGWGDVFGARLVATVKATF
jgi:uncharacterized protein (TIGR02001 family)